MMGRIGRGTRPRLEDYRISWNEAIVGDLSMPGIGRTKPVDQEL